MKKPRRREQPIVRKEEILNAAIDLASKIGYQSITRKKVAENADISLALINQYFSTMTQLKKAVMKTAIEREIVTIIAQGISLGDTQTKTIKKELREKVLTFFTN